LGKLEGARRSFTQPKRDRGWYTLSVDHANDAALDALDAPGGAAQQEDIAGHALDRKIFVDRADEGVPWLFDDAVVCGVPDCTS
jgi:hypothetical protein